jgi:hypothetical protein
VDRHADDSLLDPKTLVKVCNANINAWEVAVCLGPLPRLPVITGAFPVIESKALCNGLAFFLAAITSVA